MANDTLGHAVGRRRFLTGTASAGLAAGIAAVGGSALAGCSRTQDGEPAGELDRAATLPAYTAFRGVTPDYPALGDAGTSGFTRFPQKLVDAAPGTPLSGGTVTVSIGLEDPAPTQLDRNDWWKNVNRLAGATLDFQAVPVADYDARLATLLAGDQLPDLVQITPRIPNRADVLAARFTELSDHLAGTKSADYPMLANLPTRSWKDTQFDGGLYGVPYPLPPITPRWIGRQEIIRAAGRDAAFASAEEFLSLCQAVTDASRRRWAIGQPIVSTLIGEMFGVPNTWAVTDGTFTHAVESPQYVEALSYLVRLWKAGVIHPDAFGTLNVLERYRAGSLVFREAGGLGMVTTFHLDRQVSPDIELVMLVPPKADGSGQAAKYLGDNTYKFFSIPRDRPREKVQELLALLNKFAAPFGTTEHLASTLGQEGVNFTFDAAGTPIPIASGTAQKIPINYLPGSPLVYFAPGNPQIVTAAVEWEKKVLDVDPLPKPQAGLYSASEAKKQAALNALVADAVSGIVQGRQPVSAWDDLVKRWRSTGGDDIRRDYEADYARTR